MRDVWTVDGISDAHFSPLLVNSIIKKIQFFELD